MSDKLKTSWDEHYMLDAFLGFVSFSLSEPNALSAFRKETGNTWEPATTGIDKMIDEATGVDFAFIQQFSDWCEKSFGTPEDIGEGYLDRAPPL